MPRIIIIVIILCITDDYCRVVLSGDENQDYINASYIDVSYFVDITMYVTHE